MGSCEQGGSSRDARLVEILGLAVHVIAHAPNLD